LLKSRLGKAKECNEGYLSRIQELEGLLDTIPTEEPDEVIDAPKLLTDLDAGLTEEKRRYQELRRKYEQKSFRTQAQLQMLASLLNKTIQTLMLVSNRTPQIEGLINVLCDANIQPSI